MLKHSYHARLSVWHVVLMVIILAISLPVIAETVSSPAPLLKQPSPESPPVPQFAWPKTHSGAPGLQAEFRFQERRLL
jgi:hypothetical protein